MSTANTATATAKTKTKLASSAKGLPTRVRRHKELLIAEYGTDKLPVAEYLGQELRKNGYYSISGHPHIKRICSQCGQNDQTVRGQWGPAFEDDGGLVVLLCKTCYASRCV